MGKCNEIFQKYPFEWVIRYLYKKNVMLKVDQLSNEQQAVLKELGVELKRLRKNRKQSYPDMADELGLSKNTYYLMERGKLNFQFSTYIIVLNYFGISEIELLKGVDSYNSH